MLNDKRVFAIIPARGGSKRLPNKNKLLLGNKPLITWTIEAAKKSKYIDDIFVSTDDNDIAKIASSLDIPVPELRPEEISTDTATTESVVFYTLSKFGNNADILIILQPTSPFRNHMHIDEALEKFILKNAHSIISVTPCDHPPQWSNTLPSNESMYDFIKPEYKKNSQELGVSFRLNGAIYIYDVKELIKMNKMSYDEKSFAYKMPRENSIDIDEKIDFEMAEFYYERYKDKITG
ncbi:CMP-N-acetlyneuraminic acid synthetase [Vibrio cholerae]|nr:putative monosaccharide biosynthesis protein [Vibrio cholerae]GHY28929.1 CMP-N-acetlyneuraminic acid synthetase [Vibrio cholerae]